MHFGSQRPNILFDIIGVLLQGILAGGSKENTLDSALAPHPVERRGDPLLYLFAHIPNFRLRCRVKHILILRY